MHASLLTVLALCNPSLQGPKPPGLEIHQTLGNVRLVTQISPDGVVMTQYPLGSSIPARGALLRYRDQQAFGLDYDTRRFRGLSLDEAIAQRLEERAHVSGPTVMTESELVFGPIAPAELARLPGNASIQGLSARVYELADFVLDGLPHGAVRQWRLHYANALPAPPDEVREKLAALQPGQCDGQDKVVICHVPPGSPENRHTLTISSSALSSHLAHGDTLGRCDGDSDPCSRLAEDLAGRTLLRAEILTDTGWKTVLDTERVLRVTIPSDALDPPQGWQDQDEPAGLSAESFGGCNTDPCLLRGPGPIIGHPRLHVFFWGRTFAIPGHGSAVSQLLSAHDRFFQGAYAQGLAQYGISTGNRESWRIVNDDPPSYAGDGGVGAAVGAFVTDRAFNGEGPMFWFTVGDDDPLYVVLIPAEVVNEASWGGVHFFMPNFIQFFVPWPFSLFLHEAMPYAVVKVPEAALDVPAQGLFFRCGASEPLDSRIGAFDSATRRLSHEYAEAVTDPYPFFGWVRPHTTPWTDGEVADICRESGPPAFSAPPESLIGEIVLSTFWSNNDFVCVPSSPPALTVFEPGEGDMVSWAAGGPSVFLRAFASHPNGCENPDILWTVDGVEVPENHTPFTQAHHLALGSHTIRATAQYHYSESTAERNAEVHITVVAEPPVATITSPADGATYGTDATIAFRGFGSDLQDGTPMPDSALYWFVNGEFLGQGSLLLQRIATQGDAVVSLRALNSAGQIGFSAEHVVHIVGPLGLPSVIITAPEDGAQFRFDTDIIPFAATASDAAGNSIPDNRIEWVSDIDGFLGFGSTLPHALSGGPSSISSHLVTCSVLDSNLRENSDSIFVHVGQIGLAADLPRPPSPAGASRVGPVGPRKP